MSYSSDETKKPKDNEKKAFVELKTALGIIVGLFVSGVTTTVIVQNYLDKRAEDMFYGKTAGQLVDQRVHIMEENYKEQTGKMETLQIQQNQVLIELGKINGKIDLIQNNVPSRHSR